MKKVVIAGRLPVDAIPELSGIAEVLNTSYNAISVEPTEEALLEIARRDPDFEVIIIVWTRDMLVSAEVLEAFPKLELIVSTYGGVKRNVDVDAAMSRGIRMTCTGPARARSVAEFTLALVMDSLLSVSRTHHDMRSGVRFPRYGYTRELTGRTVGIIGFGEIAREFVSLLSPFRTDTLVASRHASRNELEERGARSASLEEIARVSDVVVLLTGLSRETEGMIDAGFLSEMKSGSILVNTARGKLIVESALIDELAGGRISAALDVYESEPLADDSALRGFANVVLTAHSANSTREMDAGRWEFALSELESYRRSGELKGELTKNHIRAMSDD